MGPNPCSFLDQKSLSYTHFLKGGDGSKLMQIVWQIFEGDFHLVDCLASLNGDLP